MKVRVGYGLGVRTRPNDEGFAAVVDALEALRFDSLWPSERIGGAVPDPVEGMAFVAGRTDRLKLGMSVMVLLGRNPVVVAKGLRASIAFRAGGCPGVRPGVADPHSSRPSAWSGASGRPVRRGPRRHPRRRTDERVTLTGRASTTTASGSSQAPTVAARRLLGGIAPSEFLRVAASPSAGCPACHAPRRGGRARCY